MKCKIDMEDMLFNEPSYELSNKYWNKAKNEKKKDR